MTGPVSDHLTALVRDETRQHGIVVWLDKDADYVDYCDDLAARHQAGKFPYPVFNFRGSFLELMFALEEHGSAVDPEHMLIHLPGFTEPDVKGSPVLELYAPGFRFRKAIDTLVREASLGRVGPDDIQSFLDRPDTSLAAADRWLETLASGDRGELAAVIERLGPAGLVEMLFAPGATLPGSESGTEKIAALRAALHRLTGMDDAWVERFAPQLVTKAASDDPERAFSEQMQALRDAAGGWILCAEYVRDLRTAPVTPELVRLKSMLIGPLEKTCLELARTFREKWPNEYEQVAREVERWLPSEQEAARADDLGRIDTFPFEEGAILEAALRSLGEGQWDKPLEWARTRRVESSFWVLRDRKRQWTWELIQLTAELGAAIAKTPRPLADARSLEAAIDRYTETAWKVDHQHRVYEQRWNDIGPSSLDHYLALFVAKQRVGRAYRDWTNTLSRDFTKVCAEHGFLPDRSLQQRTIHESVVHPLVSGGERVAVFLVDALRYEMAVGLAEELKDAGTVVDLKARFAELPTITSVGMNALAPLADNGRLLPVLKGEKFDGFRSSEFIVSGRADRAKAMGLRSVGKAATVLSMSELRQLDRTKLKRKLASGPALVVVCSDELDTAGEKGFGLATFEQTLGHIRAAIKQLQSAGVKQIVVTSDHGFMLRDEDSPAQPYGKRTDPDRRHVLSSVPRSEPGMVSVPLKDLGYEVKEPRYLLLREDAAVWETTAAHKPFVHGGNSPQERIIPVLTVIRQRAPGTSAARFSIEVHPGDDLLGQQRIYASLKGQGELGFGTRARVALAIRAVDREDVTARIAAVTGGAKLEGTRILIPLRSDDCEVLFTLEGDSGEPAQIELQAADPTDEIEPARLAVWFPVKPRRGSSSKSAPPPGEGAPPPSESPPPPSARASTWEAAIEDPKFRQVFVHLDQHGSINEEEVTKLLGSPRAVRAFSRAFESLLPLVPFSVRIHTQAALKVYVKEAR